MKWLARWWGGFVEADPRRASFPIVILDDEEPPTDKTQVMRRDDDTTDGRVEPGGALVTPARPFDPPRARDVGRPRVKPVVVRVTLAEWRALVREANSGEDLGDVLRRWARLPPVGRR